MRFKFISPFKADLHPGVENIQNRILRELEAEDFLKGIEWDLDPGISLPGGRVGENREQLVYAAVNVVKLVREACESGKYDAIIIIGGLEPGLYAAKEIGARFGIPVLGFTSSEVAFAYILGHRYSIIDIFDLSAIAMRQNMMYYGMNEKCASVRTIELSVLKALEQYDKKEESPAVDAFVRESIEAIEKDGADVILVGCTAMMWIQPFAQKRLKESGYDVPVLNSFKCAIELAKALVNMKVSQSKIAFPNTTPKKKGIPR